MDILREHALKPDAKVKINKVEVLLNSVLGEVHKVGLKIKEVDERSVRTRAEVKAELDNVRRRVSDAEAADKLRAAMQQQLEALQRRASPADMYAVRKRLDDIEDALQLGAMTHAPRGEPPPAGSDELLAQRLSRVEESQRQAAGEAQQWANEISAQVRTSAMEQARLEQRCKLLEAERQASERGARQQAESGAALDALRLKVEACVEAVEAMRPQERCVSMCDCREVLEKLRASLRHEAEGAAERACARAEEVARRAAEGACAAAEARWEARLGALVAPLVDRRVEAGRAAAADEAAAKAEAVQELRTELAQARREMADVRTAARAKQADKATASSVREECLAEIAKLREEARSTSAAFTRETARVERAKAEALATAGEAMAEAKAAQEEAAQLRSELEGTREALESMQAKLEEVAAAATRHAERKSSWEAEELEDASPRGEEAHSGRSHATHERPPLRAAGSGRQLMLGSAKFDLVGDDGRVYRGASTGGTPRGQEEAPPRASASESLMALAHAQRHAWQLADCANGDAAEAAAAERMDAPLDGIDAHGQGLSAPGGPAAAVNYRASSVAGCSSGRSSSGSVSRPQSSVACGPKYGQRNATGCAVKDVYGRKSEKPMRPSSASASRRASSGGVKQVGSQVAATSEASPYSTPWGPGPSLRVRQRTSSSSTDQCCNFVECYAFS
ncbi:hypothetical protein AB1Y20_021141 [Prymnesium parvum]|uniref:Centrosomal protein of 70 kDa n=1 Tax=Prymnesium parvum TaxID=97485 RepID=A0AB34JIV5_PRYPA